VPLVLQPRLVPYLLLIQSLPRSRRSLAEDDRLSEAEEAAFVVLLDIKPVTRKGAAALLRYVADLELRGEGRQFEADLTVAKHPHPIGGQYGMPSYFVQHNVADFLLIAEA
jgi:hypothetical protein